MLERNDWLGGAIRTAEITEPGFVHEVLAAWHPLFTGSAAYAELKDDLEERGLEYLNTELPTATLFPDGESAFLTTSHEQNVAALGPAWERTVAEFTPNADLAFGVLSTELWSRDGAALGWKALRRLGRRGLVEFTGNVLVSARDWLTETFEDERTRGLLAPWVLHTGLGPDAASSGFMAQVVGIAIELGGMPVPRGGGVRLAEALAGIVRDAGGALETERPVERILVSGGRATGVRTVDGEEIGATRAVLANVTPQQLYGELLATDVPEARRFRFGRGEMQIHFALSEPPRWQGDERLGRTAIVHVTPGLDAVSRAVNEADRGLLPAEATVVVGQPMAVDPSRAPEGAGSSGSSCRRCLRGRRATRPASSRPATARGPRSCGSGTRTGSRRGSPRMRRTSSRRSCGASRSRLRTSRPRTRTCRAATFTPARARSTRTSSGDRGPACPATGRGSTASGTSARARIPARGSAPARERSSRRSCCGRRSPGGCRVWRNQYDPRGERAKGLRDAEDEARRDPRHCQVGVAARLGPAGAHAVARRRGALLPARDTRQGRARVLHLRRDRLAPRGAALVRGEPRLRLARREPDPRRAPRLREGRSCAARAVGGDHPRRRAVLRRLGRGARELRLRDLPPVARAARRAQAPVRRVLPAGRRAVRHAARRLRAGHEGRRRARDLRPPEGGADSARRCGCAGRDAAGEGDVLRPTSSDGCRWRS